MYLDVSKFNKKIKVIYGFTFMIWIAVLNGVNATESETDRFTGYWEIGFRNVDLQGSENKYRQHMNLDNGFWLSAFGLVYLPEKTSAFTPDKVEISASNLGNEPYQNLRFDVRKYGSYHLRYKRQKSEYFYQDILIDPADENPESSNGGDFHHFDFDRVRDQFNLDINLSENAKFLVDLNQYTKKGESTTVLDVEREEFELEQPVDQKLKNYNLGFEYHWDNTAVKVNQRWRDFNNDVEIYLLNPSEGSAPLDPTQLDNYYLEQPYGYNSRETQVDFSFRPSINWQVQVNALYADLDMDLESLELATGLDFVGDLLLYNFDGEGQSFRTIRQLYLSFGYAINDTMRLKASFRNQNLEQNSYLNLDDIISENEWSIDSTTAVVGLETILNKDWSFTSGFSIEEREVSTVFFSEDIQHIEDEKTRNNGYYMILGYRPKLGLSLTASAEKNIINDPFTLSSPTDSETIRLRFAYKWESGINLSSAYAWKKNENDLSSWQTNSKHASLRLGYSNDPILLAVGTTIVDVDRSIDQLVTGGFVQTLFPIYYRADSDFWDAMLRWKVSAKTSVTTNYRSYDNNGNFEVKRNDARLGINYDLPNDYSLGANFRKVDYKEDFEKFNAEILEITFSGRW